MNPMQPGPFNVNDRAEACALIIKSAFIQMARDTRANLVDRGFDACDASIGLIRAVAQAAASSAFSFLTPNDHRFDESDLQAIADTAVEIEQLLYDRASALAAKLRDQA